MLENSYIIVGGITQIWVLFLLTFWLIFVAVNFIKKL